MRPPVPAIGLVAGLLCVGPMAAQGPTVVPISAVAIRPSAQLQADAIDPAYRDRVLKVIHQPTLSARAAPDALPLGIYYWLLDNPDRASLAWRRLGIPCSEIANRGDGSYGWSDGQGTDVGWRTVGKQSDRRIWYAEGHTRLGPLLPVVPVRAVAVLHHTRQMGPEGRSVVTQHADVYVQTDSKAAAAVARLVGPTAPRLAEQGAGQLLLFFSGLTRYFDAHPEDIPVLLGEKVAQLARDGSSRSLHGMADTQPVSYRDAGLDLDVYDQTIAGLQPLLARTKSPRVLGGFGGFAGLFSLDVGEQLKTRQYKHPVLVACTDGVGTKLKLASLANRHTTVGIDLVAMSVNDALCTGGEPLIFLDYVAMPKDDPTLTRDIVQGISDGCVEAGCALVGGETAILPDVYAPGDYDLAGFCVGVVERNRIIDGSKIAVGDVVLGLPSSGLHSNGYSLARKIVFDVAGLKVDDLIPELSKTVADELLTPTTIYVKPIRQLLAHFGAKRAVKGLAHITGGGLVDNLPRILPPGRKAVLERGSWPVPPVFGWLQQLGSVADAEMDRVFNGGIGFAVVVGKRFVDEAQQVFAANGVTSYRIGAIKRGDPSVSWD